MEDTFRKNREEVVISDEVKIHITAIKEKAEELLKSFEEPFEGADARMMALAKTKLEECVMWAVKGITK
jgi:hypothetical protein